MAGEYDALIANAAARHNIDQRLLRAVLQRESGIGRNVGPSIPNDPDSPIGIAQMRPSTMRGLLGPNANPLDPPQAIDAAAAYLNEGMSVAEKAGISNPGAYAAAYYNGGPGHAGWGEGVSKYVAGVGSALSDLGYQPSSAGAAATQATPAAAANPNSRLVIAPAAAQNLDRVDPRLTSIITQASSYLPQGWHAELISGFDDRPTNPTSLHPQGKAVDVQLYDDQGNKIPNYQSPANFRTYEQFAQGAKLVQMANFPELNDQFAWGGYFHNQGLGHYGAADLMHFSFGEHPAGGDWAGGLNETGKGAGFATAAAPSRGMGDLAQYTPDLPLYRLPSTTAAGPGAPAPMAVVGQVAPVSAGVVQRPPAAPAGGAPGTGSLDVAMANVPDLSLGMPTARVPRPTPTALPSDLAQLAQVPASPAPLPGGQVAPLPGGQEARAVLPPRAPAAPSAPNPLISALISPAEAATPSASPGAGPPSSSGAMATAPLPPPLPAAAPARTLSDEQVSKMMPEDVLSIVGRQDLTDADRAAIAQRLGELSPSKD